MKKRILHCICLNKRANIFNQQQTDSVHVHNTVHCLQLHLGTTNSCGIGDWSPVYCQGNAFSLTLGELSRFSTPWVLGSVVSTPGYSERNRRRHQEFLRVKKKIAGPGHQGGRHHFQICVGHWCGLTPSHCVVWLFAQIGNIYTRII